MSTRVRARDPGAPGRLGRPRDPAVRHAILAAANTLLREKGYGAFSMEAAAALAGVAKQTIYRRWPSRADLLLDLYLGEEEDAGTPSPRHTGFEGAIHDYVLFSVRRLFDPSRAALLRGLAIEAQSDPDVRRVMLERITAPRLESGRRLLLRGIAEGRVRPDLDADMALRFLHGGVWFDLLFGGLAIERGVEQRILAQFLAMITLPEVTGGG